MADDEIQRGIEFLVQQQAKYDARLEKDESRLAELQESFKTLVELARVADERQDTLGDTMATLSRTMNELVQRSITDEVRRASLEESFKLLVELARGMDERLDILDRTMLTLSHSMNELAQRTITDESRVASLEVAFTMLAHLAHTHE